ncbi:ABC transporter permease [Mucilaginibacter jinjuensis]|uniref:ABC transporter permease n=1 Tax=Mucilaginibacter jinjuensis TaxID=1176721 RepID=A0ABY7T539_9SPHI|nr:ABC transporter permease [Mucilaginibacter jinjuensis]WCT10898.1 ABC transporter permease [Mucilaginibacter jinjuensis]
MVRNYIKIAWRNLVKNKFSSLINIGGLAVGMAVAMLIGLWVWDELSFDKYHQNYNSVAIVMQNQTYNGDINTNKSVPVPLGAELQKNYSGDFKHIVMASQNWPHIVRVGDKNLFISGSFMQSGAPDMFSLKIIAGTASGLNDPSSILLSQASAKALFGNADPINKTILMDNKANFKVTGVYEYLPQNTTLHYIDLAFIAPWDYYTANELSKGKLTDWGDNSYRTYVQLAAHADINKVSAKIKDVKLKHLAKEDIRYKPQLFLHPMSKWHLYSQFKNGVIVGGKIQYVWLFGIVGIFVLLLACINFMNLSTARSEKRAKEVGIRKAIGSERGQLIIQFYCESVLIAVIAFVFALVMVSLTLPFFNQLADKNIVVLWDSPLFWLMGIGFSLFTGLVAGSYPALYLSSFKPVKVLKGTFKGGRFAAIPRQVLVVLQFSVSVILIIGTIIVFKQIEFAKNRPVGYSREGLVAIPLTVNDLHQHFEAMKTDLLQSGAVANVAESTSSTTHVSNNTAGFQWTGKAPELVDDFGVVGVTTDFGKTVGWQFTAGRDFSKTFATDSSGIVLNESAVKFMGLKNPVGETVKFWGADHKVIGVVKDMVMDSPYEPVKQTVFYFNKNNDPSFVNIKINPQLSTHDALTKIEAICKAYSPSSPFMYRFADEEYARKFEDEQRIGKLAGCFAGLAIFISCLGLFGMASFMAEQRTKEIGVRKVLGASVFSLWRLLSNDFVLLVLIALFIATPIAYYFMYGWLQHYNYHTVLSWWVFVVTGLGAVSITLLTVSYQSIKAALMNPVKSLRSE